jgi:hypothetical protein
MGLTSDVQRSRSILLLEVASQAEHLVSFKQPLLVDRPVRVVADDATFPKRFVLEDERASLFGVTLETDLVFVHHVGCAPAFEY